MSDPDRLLARLRAGDEAAFVELVRAHHGALQRLAASVVGSSAAAEEVVQDTWEAALESLASFEGRSSLKTWLFRICLNRARTRRERERRTTPLSALEPEEGEGPAVDPGRFAADGHWSQPPEPFGVSRSPEGDALRRELGSHLEAALAGLPERYRTVVALRDIDGLAAAEVCNVMAITESNQRVLLHRARARLRASLEEYLEGRKKR